MVLGGLGLGAVSLVPWYEADPLALETDRTNGWQAPDASLSQAAVVGGVAIAVVVLLTASQRRRSTLGGPPWGTVLTGASGVVFGLLALKFGLNLDGTQVGVYLALAAGGLQLYGAYVTRLNESAAVPMATFDPTVPVVDQPPGPPGTPASPPPEAPAAPTPPAATAWPETAYFVATWLHGAPDVEPAVVEYRRAFAADPARAARFQAELAALLDPRRRDAELDRFLWTLAPRWSNHRGRGVLGQVMRALTEGGNA